MRGTWVIDDNGDVWSEGNPALSRKFRTHRIGKELTAFLVRQMGFISVMHFGNRTNVSFDADRVAPSALVGFLDWASARTFAPTTVEAPSEKSVATLFHDRGRLFDHFGELHDRRAPRPDYSLQAIPLDKSNFASRWKSATEIFHLEPSADRADLYNSLFHGHFMIAKLVENGEYKMDLLGSAHYRHDAEFASTHVNKGLREAYDAKYGNWTADTFSNLRDSNQPVAEVVDALIAFPKHPRKRYYYERLTLPLQSRSGEKFLLSAVTME